MTIREHADQTEKKFGIRAVDIHKWIDGFFDAESFELFIKGKTGVDFNPYEHRRYRHCREALKEAYQEFQSKYSKDQIKAVFESHLKDDYNGYIPCRNDFENGLFREKYHERGDFQDKVLTSVELSEYFKGKNYQISNKNKQKTDFKFLLRIILPVLIALVLFLGTGLIFIIPVYYDIMMNNKKILIKELVNTAASSISYYIQEEKNHNLTRQEAQKMAHLEVEKMRYGVDGKDYFFITDMHPFMIMHPYRNDLVGEDLNHYKDSEDKSGKKIFVEFVKIVKNYQEGYLEYCWQWMDDTDQKALKLSYVKGIPEWNWIIGTGIYINDIEEEINAFTDKLLLVFSIISLMICLALFYVIMQSKKIETNRQYFELGLIEAKNRYRALVESANEGYILEIGGEHVYSNHTLQRLLDYNEEELTELKLFDLLDKVYPANLDPKEYLTKLYQSFVEPKKFEARLITKGGYPIDLIISVSNLFFSQKNGHVISFREKQQNKEHIFSRLAHFPLLKSSFNSKQDHSVLNIQSIVKNIIESNESTQIIKLLNQLPQQVSHMLNTGLDPQIIRSYVNESYQAASQKFIEIAVKALGQPPVKFCFFALGSSARGEMTLFSDQDNALVYQDVSVANKNEVEKYFLKLSSNVNQNLDQAGFHICPGGLVASNSKWCLTLSHWQALFQDWFEAMNPEAFLKINVFADTKYVYGNQELLINLQENFRNYSQNNTPFFNLYVNNSLLYKVPMNLLGGIKTDKKKKKKNINIKACLKPLEIGSRIYALKNEITATSTSDRLYALLNKKKISSNLYQNSIYAFYYLWNLRFYNQIILNADLEKLNDELDLSRLSEIEVENLKTVLNQIQNFQNRLNSDFIGRVRI
ncbi:MAG: DUF294 nucleotidyltransferase-like domain-containing protein [Spirochaetes bacterium]|nr:DUF294 nucleotidyltransferase-like domain-containing protein [Spirochaetota bacterium]